MQYICDMAPALHEQIQSTVEANPVVLYMKGTRARPQCGFSASVVGILDGLLADYVTVNVLDDAALREGIKEFSSWPTIPQLYVRGKFVGGADIVAALEHSGVLRETLGELAATKVPQIRISATARAELTGALESKDECIRLDVSPVFDHDLAVGVPEPRDIIVDLGDGLRVSLPPSAARRADGITIDLVATPEGPAFKIDNPNEPPRVKQLSPRELAARLERGDDVVMLDVRPEGERRLASFEGLTPLEESVLDGLENGAPERALVLVCHHGMRSQSVAEELVQRGLKNVHNLAGGIDAWSADVDPRVPRY